MFSKIKISSIALHKGDMPAFPSEHLLFSVKNSSGQLRMVWYIEETEVPPYENRYTSLLLNDLPLIRAQLSVCPTCESFLAAGYGLPEGSPEVAETLKLLRMPYDGLEAALKSMQPIVGLLQPGLHILSYSQYFPTNGDGRFFWDVPEELTAYKATAELYDQESYRGLPCFPCFLYPSQPAEKYDPARVEYYRQSIRAGNMPPPALACSIYGYMSVLLDGHHRACACALEGIPVPCLTLSRPVRILRNSIPHIVWPDNSESAVEELLSPEQKRCFNNQTEGELMKSEPPSVHPIKFPHHWPAEYSNAVHRFPTCWEAGCLTLYPEISLTAKGIRTLVQDDDYEEAATAASLLVYAARQLGADAKLLAMEFVDLFNPTILRRTAFEILDKIKDDGEVDDLMIQILIDCQRKDDPIYQIANGHWG